MNIYVGNLARTVTEEQLKSLFSQFGTVVSVKLIKDKFTGDVRGFAFVQMSTHDEGLAAIAALDNTPFEGRTLRVNEARPREERPRDDRNGGHRDDRGGSRGGRPGYGSGNGRSSSRY